MHKHNEPRSKSTSRFPPEPSQFQRVPANFTGTRRKHTGRRKQYSNPETRPKFPKTFRPDSTRNQPESYQNYPVTFHCETDYRKMSDTPVSGQNTISKSITFLQDPCGIQNTPAAAKNMNSHPHIASAKQLKLH